MNIKLLKPRFALSKALIKKRPSKEAFEKFVKNAGLLISQTNETESEEFHKGLISDFLKLTYYSPSYFVNTKGNTDLVLHSGPDSQSKVGVLIETKKPTNTTEMVDTKNINKKAFHEIVYYYLIERIENDNKEIKNLIITNVHEWFVIDAWTIEKLFVENKSFLKTFRDFRGGQLPSKKTSFFYDDILKTYIDGTDQELEMTYFDLRDYKNSIKNVNNSGIFIKGKSRKGYLFLPWSNIGKIGAGRFQIPGQTQFTSGISVPLKITNSEWKFIAGIRKKEMEGEFARFIVSGHSRNIEEVLERINLFRNNMA